MLGVWGKPDKLDIELINHPNIARIVGIYLLFALTVPIAIQGLIFVRQEIYCLSQSSLLLLFGHSDP
jgi:hypothetical protein